MRTILIGYDGSERGDDALALGRALAGAAPDGQQGGSPLVVATVYPPPPSIGRTGARRDLAEALREEADEQLVRAREAAPELPGEAFRTVAATSAGRGLHALAEELDADVIVVGASHHAALGRVFPGSVTEQVLPGAPCAVAVAPPGWARGPRSLRRLGVGFDGSDESRRALEAAGALARSLGAAVTVFDVVDTNPSLGAVYAYPGILDDMRTFADERLEAARELLHDVGPVQTQRLEGPAARMLAEAAENVDLLALGSRGYGPVSRLLLGSVSTRLVRSAPCPLLILPRGAAGKDVEEPATAGTADAET